ncbi:MAG: glycosyltransferase [Candidatus Brocadiae bacterium]|nr:glycosyltransferase [Candidatus Brocadiia bacterium]
MADEGTAVPAARRRVLFVVDTLSGGGAERFVSTCLAHLDRASFEPHLALLRDEVVYPLPDDVHPVILGKRRWWHFGRAARRLAAWLHEHRPHVVLSALEHCSAITDAALNKATVPRPFWIARTANQPQHGLNWIESSRRQQAYRHADRILANSQGSADAFVRMYPFTRHKLRVIGNPTDFEQIDRMAREPVDLPDADVPTVIAVARLAQQKRPDVLVEAFARVRSQMVARLAICGDGPQRRAVERLVRDRGLADCVVLAGFQPNPYAWMARSDLFVLSSDYEGLPNALIEAQGLGLPAVSTSCPSGPSEIIEDGVTGILVPCGNAARMAEAVLALLQDTDRRRAFGQAARQRIRQQYGVGPLLSELCALLRERTTSGPPHDERKTT